ncbi:MAG: DUF3267 domain-containing protein, partial [Rhodothermales bacterium]|nr:DUF3267 domain-containing protein [Rhodothermales bacterium]
MPDLEEWVEVTIPIREIVGRLGWWLFAAALLLYGTAFLVWGPPQLPAWPWTAEWLHEVGVSVGLLVVAYVVSVPVHEGLHAVGMMLTGTRLSEITFGARILQGIVYVHCAAPMPLSAYRTVLLLPVIVTGFLPAVVGIAVGNHWVTTYAYLMIVSAIGDLEMFRRLRPWPRDVIVRDHPSELGCEVRVVRQGGDR